MPSLNEVSQNLDRLTNLQPEVSSDSRALGDPLAVEERMTIRAMVARDCVPGMMRHRVVIVMFRWLLAAITPLFFSYQTRGQEKVLVCVPTAICSVAVIGEPYTVIVGEQIEGIESKLFVRFSNESGAQWKDLSVKSSCGCLASKSIDGKPVAPNEKLDVEITIIPSTRQGYQQNFELRGLVGESVDVSLLAVITIKARVSRPVSVHPSGFSLVDLRRKDLKSMVVSGSAQRVDILWDEISLDSADLSIRVEKKADVNYANAFYGLKEGGDVTHADRDLTADLVVPFQVKGNENVFISRTPIQFFMSRVLKISPSVVRLRRRSSLDDYDCRVVVTDRRGVAVGPLLTYQIVRKRDDGAETIVEQSITPIKMTKQSDSVSLVSMTLKREWFDSPALESIEFFLRVINEDHSKPTTTESVAGVITIDIPIVMEVSP